MSAPNDIMKSMYSLPSSIPDVGALAALEKYRAGREDGRAARRRVHAFDQRLLGALEPLLRVLCDLQAFAKELHDSHGFPRILTDQESFLFFAQSVKIRANPMACIFF